MNTIPEDLAPEAEAPRTESKVEKPNGTAPRWRNIIELLVVGGILWLAAHAYNDAAFQAVTTQTLAQMQAELKAIVKVVPARYGDPK